MKNDLHPISDIWNTFVPAKMGQMEQFIREKVKVRVTAVTVTVVFSDSFGNPRFITNKTPLLTVTKNRLQ